jgi:hypothetical protein
MKKNIDEIPVLTSAQIRGASTFAQRRQAKRGSGDGYHLIIYIPRMPRRPRLNVPGCLHHIMARGID